tara:strand:- start:296 stop:2401 length:2106 start_codon:yes stop_codon:yes gene_type:complete
MSLLKKASIITTPTAYAEDYLYSIKPAYALSSELVTNGDFSNGSNNWNVQTGWSIANGIATVNHNATTAITQSLSGVRANFLYEIKLTISNYTQGLIQPQFSGQVITQFTGNGEHTFQVVSTSSTPTLYLYAISNPQFSIDNVSIKEITKADFDFDRNSTGTRVNEDYLIEDVPYNLVSYSEDFSDSSWSKYQSSVTSGFTSPDGKNNAFKLVESSSNDSHILFKNNITTGSGKTTLSIKAKAGERKWILFGDFEQNNRVYFDLENGVAGTVLGSPDSYSITSVKNGWYNITLTSTSVTQIDFQVYLATGNNQATYQGDGSSGVYIWGAQLVKGDQPKDYLKTTDRLDIPRIDYTNGEPSILLEPSRTNLETKSQDIANWGLVSNVTRTASYTQSPEGLNNATRLQFTANGYTASFTQSNSTQYTLSCYAKRNDKGTQNFGFFTNGSGTVDSQFALTSTWQRFTYTYTSSNTSYAGLAGLSGADVSVYGMQVEAASYATSLIHTSGSTVTRSADAATNAGNSDLINSTEGVLYAEIKALANDLTFRTISLSDGTTPNSIRIYYNNVSNSIVFAIFLSGAVQSVYTASVSDITEFHKVAYKYKANDFSVFVDGRQVHTDTSGSVFSANTLNSLQFNSGAGSERIYGDVKSVMVFKEALTDLELEKLTGYNNHELYMNYYNRLSYLGLAEEYNVESDINNYIL